MNDTRDPQAGAETGSTAGGGTGPGPAPSPPPVRRLVRSRTDRKVAGVAGGLGAYTGLDPVIFRLGLVLATFFGGSGLLAYAIAWIVLPEGDTTTAGARRQGEDDTSSLISLIVGGFLLVLGISTLFDLADIGFLWPVSWPVAMIAAGVAVIVWARRRNEGEATTDPSVDGPARPQGRASSSTATSTASTPPTGSDLLPVPFDDTTSADTLTGLDDPTGGETGDGGGHDDGPPRSGDGGDGPPDPHGPNPPPTGRALRGISATALTVAAIFLFLGVATLGHLAEWWDLAPGTVFGGALLLCGAGLVASAWIGRGLLLIPLGVICAVGLAAAAWIDVPIRGGIGERTALPMSIDDVDDPFRLAIGRLELDLTDLDVEGTVGVEASVGIGELTVLVPDDVGLDVETRAGMGQVVLSGTGISHRDRTEGGMGSSIERRLAAPERPGDVIELEARVGMGQVIVERVAAAQRTDGGPQADSTPQPPTAGTSATTSTTRFDR